MRKVEPSEHIPVLLPEILNLLITDRKGVYFDGTLGDGGYTKAIVERLDAGGIVVATDWDDEAVGHAEQWIPAYSQRVAVYHRNFCEIGTILRSRHIEAVQGIILDLGLALRHIRDPGRGFSYFADGPLDMRMDTRQTTTAYEILNGASREELKRIFFSYGEERRSASLAEIIVRERKRSPLKTTFDLVSLMKKHWRVHYFTKSASRIFQALRIAVNGELDNLERFLDVCWDFLLPGGRIAVVSYHSLEDRIVKSTFNRHRNPCICPKEAPVCRCGKKPDARIITRKIIRPSEEEISFNPRARSAKLRVAEKV